MHRKGWVLCFQMAIVTGKSTATRHGLPIPPLPVRFEVTLCCCLPGIHSFLTFSRREVAADLVEQSSGGNQLLSADWATLSDALVCPHRQQGVVAVQWLADLMVLAAELELGQSNGGDTRTLLRG